MRLSGFLLCLLLSPLGVDARELLINRPGQPAVVLTEADLEAHFGLTTLTLFDIEYQQDRRYQGVLLRDVLRYGGFNAGEGLILKAVDGYSIAFDSAVLQQQGLIGLIAMRDLDAPEGRYFEPFLHGREWVDFAPFYLVWLRLDETATALEKLPWPYQLHAIESNPSDYYAAIAPPLPLQSAYHLYLDHCVKCHAIKGIGGSLGPGLDRDGGMAQYLDDSRLHQMIGRVTDFFPKTKMPVFETSLSADEIDQLVAYIRWSTRLE